MAMRKSEEMSMRFSVSCPMKPSSRQPERLMSSVPYGKPLPIRICTTPCKPYRASVPIAPNSAIRKSFTPSPLCDGEQFTSEVEAVANLSGELPGIVPVGSAERIRVVQQVARIVQVLRGKAHRQAFAEGLR